MNTQGFGARVPLPDELESAISLGEAKVAVLRDEEIRLNQLKSELEKDVARLQILDSSLKDAIPALEEKVAQRQNNLAVLDGVLAEKTAALELVESDRKVALKELEALHEQATAESSKLSTIAAQARDIEASIENRRAELHKSVAAFDERKNKLVELLASF